MDQEKFKQTQQSQLSSSMQMMSQEQQNDDILIGKVVPFDRQNRDQQFYRQLEQLQQRTTIVKLGWKITDLKKEQEDLVFFCYNLLSSQIKIPIKLFTNQFSLKKGSSKSLWVETSLSTLPQDFYRFSQKDMQAKIYKFYVGKLVPMMRLFILENINWDQMRKKEFDSGKVVELFKKKVIQRANFMIAEQFLKM